MTGRIARAAVTSKPDVAVTKVHGRAQVKFGVYERAVNRFALDLYKAEGFSHEPALVRYLYDAVDARTLVVDIGAHFGYFSCLVAALGGTVLAVELQRTLCQNIEANIVLNDFWRIHVFCAAIGPAPGVTQIERLDPSPGKQVTNHQFTGSTYPMNSQNHDLVPVITVDSLIGERFTDDFDRVIVKVDIEWAEILALRGARQTVDAKAAIFIVEIHLSEIGKFDGTMDEVLDTFPETDWRMVQMLDDREEETTRATLQAFSADWEVADGNLCVRFEPVTR
jgi:FkbM family methyltransferase